MSAGQSAEYDYSEGSEQRPLYSRIGLILGPLLALVLYLMPAPEGLAGAGWRCLAVAVLMAVWWATEAVPVAATALLPLILFPVLQILSIDGAARPYANPLIFLFLGGFMMALGIQKTGLHRRLALNIIAKIGSKPDAVIAGFMIATALISMGVSSTATTLMMMPIAASLAATLVPADAEKRVRNFATALMLSVANAATIGGAGTLIGTPPNALLAGFIGDKTGTPITFVHWLAMGLPVVILLLPVAWAVLTRIAFPFRLDQSADTHRAVMAELAELGRTKRSERRIAGIFAAAALLWITRPLLNMVPGLAGLNDSTIAMAGGLAVFLIPHGDRRGPLMTWADMRDLPWGVILLFGGGLSLAAAVDDTGLAAWIGSALSLLSDYPVFLLVGVTVILIIFLTELTSNTGTTATFLPIVGAVALGVGQPTAQLAIPAALAASCAFMLPVATPPNAIVYSSGYITIPQMVRAGFLLNLAAIILIALLGRYYLPLLGFW